MIIGEYVRLLQVSNPDESWYGVIVKSMWAVDAISELVTAAFATLLSKSLVCSGFPHG